MPINKKQAVEMYAAGKSLGDIAEIFGVTRSAVHYSLRKLGVNIAQPPQSKTSITREQIIDLLNSGKTKTEIAKQENVSMPIINKILIRGLCKDEVAKYISCNSLERLVSREDLENMMLSGMTNQQIADKIGCSAKSLNPLFKRHDLIRSHMSIDKKQGNRNWFPLTVEQFNNLHSVQNLSLSEIARRYNIKVEWVSAWLKRHNIKPCTNPTQSANLTKDMLEIDCKIGLSTRTIAKKYNVSKSLIGQKLRDFNLKTSPKPYSGLEITSIRDKNTDAVHISSLIKEKWKDPEYKNKLTSIMSSDQYSAKISDSVIEALSDPSKLGMISAEMKARWGNYEYRSKMMELYSSDKYRDKMEQLRSTPEYKDMMQKLFTSDEFKYRIAKSRKYLSMTFPHNKVCEILKVLGIKFEIEYVPSGTHPYDIFTPEHNILIEVQGTYWHNQEDRRIKDIRDRDYIKTHHPELALYEISENECKIYGAALKRIMNMFNISSIKQHDFELDDVKIVKLPHNETDRFLYNWHYISKGRSGYDFGGHINDELIVVARFINPHRIEIATSVGFKYKEVLELSRLCIKPNFQKPNLLSWFLSRVEKEIKHEVPNIKGLVTFADKQQGHTGAVYKASNWEFVNEIAPDYYYVHPVAGMKHKKTIWDKAQRMGMSESIYAEIFNFSKVWDEGKLKFIKILK